MISCQGNKITHLYVESDDGADYYYFTSRDFEFANDYFSFQTLNKNFTLETSYKSIIIPLDSFHLRPNKKYIITNSTVGDAAKIKVEITTDSLGNIVSTNKPSCN